MFESRSFSLVISFALFSGMVGISFATERHVPSQYATIQEAIDASIPMDEVIIAPGTYTGTGNRQISFKGKSITVRSTDPTNPAVVDATIIDIQGLSLRGFEFISGEFSFAVLNGLTITGVNFGSISGGGIYIINGSNPTIKNCTITSNLANLGGGVYCTNSNPTFINCIISENSAGQGGGIYVDDNSSITIDSCHILGNSAPFGNGGGIHFTSTNLNDEITNSIISGNWAALGGGIYSNDNEVLIKNCVFNGNLANIGGGIYFNKLSNQNIISNSILWQNWPNEIFVSQNVPSKPNVTYSDIEGGWPGLGNIDADPNFAQDGEWQDELWVEGDYHLKSEGGRWDPSMSDFVIDTITSPCIDAGDPTDSVGDEVVSNGFRINMGAYGGTLEASKSLGIAPGSAGNLVISGGHKHLRLDWDAPVDNGGLQIVVHNIYRGLDPNDLSLVAEVSGAKFYFLDFNVENGTTYYYSITPENVVGEGPQLTPVSAEAIWNDSDHNGDGVVNVLDFVLFSKEWLWEAPWYVP